LARKLILLVEDNTDSRLILATVLKRFGYEVSEAADGDEALDFIQRDQPDLILLDLALPRTDGWSVASLVRSAFTASEIPIVAVTAFDSDADRGRAKRLGFSGYFCKPVEPFEVLSFVQSLIGSGERRESGERRTGDRRRQNLPFPVERRSGHDRRVLGRRSAKSR
jgi:CheY-like chemotaxis protein